MSLSPIHASGFTTGGPTDEKEFNTFFSQYFSPLLSNAQRTLGCPHEAQEVVLDVFTKVWKQRNDLSIHSNTAAYLRSAVRNRCIDYLRKRNRQRTITGELPIHRPCPSPTPDQCTTANQLDDLIEKAISDLPPKGQRIFRLNRFEGMTYQQIAKNCGVSQKTIETHMRRNLIFLRNRLQPYTDIRLS
jgi:RNA polymerase sigma-70 factor (ECF subfamily)